MSKPLWQPNKASIPHAHMYQFIQHVNKSLNHSFKNYDALYQWSIEEPEQFWKICAEFCELHFSKPPSKIMVPSDHIEKTKWFMDATLSFAENLLHRRDNHTALIYTNEAGNIQKISYADLFQKTNHLAQHLKSIGIKPGDRVAGFVTNCIETVIAMLASTSIGAIWTACSPEFGAEAVLARFSQIEPSVLFFTETHDYQGKKHTHSMTIKTFKQKLSSLKACINIANFDFSKATDDTKACFTQLPFDHPLYILYSSGTTGKPKCMVHGAGNTLIQHKKELMLHTDLHENDTIFFYTTCSWMMWHWLISSLSVGATIVLYDGAPTYPNTGKLFDLIDQFQISIFGCGAKLFEIYLKEKIMPKNTHQLNNLKTILTTGSPLIKESFDYIYQNVKKDVRVSSISGGSDIISCFALGNPLLPVYAEELQCRGLGMAVDVFNENSKPIKQTPGELVCTKPFPSMPLYFWDDADNKKYHAAYFEKFSNIWTHGDYAEITEHNGLIIHGRSDATLNPGGIRIGTADIYEHVLKIDNVIDCIAVGKQSNGDETIILFVKLAKHINLDDDIKSDIIKSIRNNLTPFHIPKEIIQVGDIPKTINGKTMEIVVKNIINGKKIISSETLANPESLAYFKKYALRQ